MCWQARVASDTLAQVADLNFHPEAPEIIRLPTSITQYLLLCLDSWYAFNVESLHCHQNCFSDPCLQGSGDLLMESEL